ncbi:spermidine/putrescine-binding protein [Bradyrhizobium yuanmingense]
MGIYLRIVGGVAALGLAAGALLPLAPAFAGEQLTVVSWGGAVQMSQRKAFFEPFSKTTGIKITEDEYNGDIAKVRAMVESKTVSWDVVDASGAGALRMCAEGIIETMDWTKLGLDRSKFTTADIEDCGVPTLASATIIAYDKGKLPNGPKTIDDLFDVQKNPRQARTVEGPLGQS